MKTPPERRILEAAKQLFYQQGYHYTGINQILTKAQAAKASFYDHFPSKTDLGVAVVQAYGFEVRFWFRDILHRSATPEFFLRELAKAIDEQTTPQNAYQGCPIALFACQFPVGEEPFSKQFRLVAGRWEKLLSSKIRTWQENGDLEMEDPLPLAQDIINLYEGALLNWRITLDKAYIHRMFSLLETRFKKSKTKY